MSIHPIKLIAVAGALILVTPSLASADGVIRGGTIARVRAQGDFGIITADQSKSGAPPACNANSANAVHKKSFTVDLRTPAGRAALATALAAQANSKRVDLVGSNACFGAFDIEKLGYVEVITN